MKPKKEFIWVEKELYKNKKTGQYSLTLSKKKLKDFFNGEQVPKKIKFKIFK